MFFWGYCNDDISKLLELHLFLHVRMKKVIRLREQNLDKSNNTSDKDNISENAKISDKELGK